jgi:hypothetical protein
MKKLILSASMLMLGLASANAQITTTSVMDDFTTFQTNSFWYSGASTTFPNGDNSVSGQLSFVYPPATSNIYLGVDFGGGTTVDLSTMADIEVDVENGSSTKDLVVRLFLKDKFGKYLEIEPNVSDCAGVNDFGTPTSGVAWSAAQQVNPAHDLGDPAVYPTAAYNGFQLAASTRKTYRIDLSSVAGSIGGRYTDGSWGNPAKPAVAPISSISTSNGFDVTQVLSVEMVMNEGTAFNLSDGAVDKQSYRFDAKGIAQSDYSGTVTFHSFKLGSVLAALPDNVTGIFDAVATTSNLSVFPNPAKEVLNVSFTANSGAEISLSNFAGHNILSTSAAAGVNQVSLNTSGLASGIYILNVTSENGTEARKVVIQ